MSQETFKKLVQKYISNDDEICNINKTLKELKSKKKEMEDEIINFMSHNNIDVVDTQDGKLKMTKTKTYTSINKTHLMTKLADKLKDEKKAEEIAQHIIENRAFNEVSKIKRS